jgi:hypothetical protein
LIYGSSVFYFFLASSSYIINLASFSTYLAANSSSFNNSTFSIYYTSSSSSSYIYYSIGLADLIAFGNVDFIYIFPVFSNALYGRGA